MAMTGWYSITPAGPVAIGNLTPVGLNSGQVGCRWPPNGHQLAACLNLPKDSQLWGPFWYWEQDIYVPLPQPVYTLDIENKNIPPENIYRLQWHEQHWQVQPDHRDKEIEMVGGRYLIPASSLKFFWKAGKSTSPDLQQLPWSTLTLSHNSREDFQVKDEGGFFAEMTTLMHSGWSILVKVIGEYTPPPWSILGAGGTPVAIAPVFDDWEWLGAECLNSTGAVLLTGALWQKQKLKRSVPYPSGAIQAYAADTGIPWQSWKKVRDRHQPTQNVTVLTPGEWLTPAGAVYLWDGVAPVHKSGPFPDQFQRHVLGYGHLWLFED